MNFFKTPALLKYIYPQYIWDYFPQAKDEPGKIYLTFDDGPVPEVTDFVLETLRDYNAQGSFFCVGDNIKKHPKIFKRIIANGHAVGNHTFNHLNGWKNGKKEYLKNVDECDKYMKEWMPLAEEKKLFRPPYGKISRAQAKQIKNDYNIIMWDILSGDYDAAFDAVECLEKCIKHTQSGTIIIFHDSYKAEKNLKYVLPRYIDYFCQKGFTFPSL